MATSPIHLAERTKTLKQRADSAQTRCQSLAGEAQVLMSDTKNAERMAKALFVMDLIVEAQSKVVETKLVAETLVNGGERAAVQLAITERWITSATDLLNRAQLVLDDQQDIWGKPLPTGGLWDK